MGKPKPEDGNLAAEQFPDLNRQYYSASLPPHEYLQGRLTGLLLSVQTPTDLPGAFDRELSVKDVGSWRWRMSAARWSSTQYEQFAIAESVVLLHHAAEALLRLYFAHVGKPRCPWLEIARLRQPNAFKAELTKMMRTQRSPEIDSAVMNVFTGRTTPQSDAWEELAGGALSLLQHCAHLLLEDGDLYNAAKHGLAFSTGSSSMQLGTDGSQSRSLVASSGPSASHLHVRKDSTGRPRWAVATHWVDLERNLVLLSTVIAQLECLWRVAKARYVGGGLGDGPMRLITRYGMTEMMQPRSGMDFDIVVPSMSLDLLYYEDAPKNSSPKRRQ